MYALGRLASTAALQHSLLRKNVFPSRLMHLGNSVKQALHVLVVSEPGGLLTRSCLLQAAP